MPCALPEAAARADDDRQEAEHEVGRDHATNLTEMPTGFGGILPLHGIAKSTPGYEKQMQEQQHHEDADALHDLDVKRCAGEASKITKHHAVAGGKQENDARPYPGKEAAEDTVPE